MKRETRKNAGATRRAARRRSRAVTWTVALGVVALIGYGISQIDFSGLTSAQKHAALEEANEERCPCGCGMTLAQCVAIDSTCPMRSAHIDLIRGMVARARAS